MIWEIALGVLVVLLIYVMSIFNRFIFLRNNIKKSWANIDVLLKQRHDELENLVAIVKGYTQHEQKVFEGVASARLAFLKAASVDEKAKAYKHEGVAMKSLFAVAESYPELKASSNYLKLQARITELEDEIADRREFYNDSVTIFNTRIDQVPYNIVAGMLKFHPRVLFRA